ncbi:hypothetical protein [Aliidiomarina quisquiliarum]|uniref:hypothetical protein n=1 Tax=Aliidiomarina quisquiliarum TaxID=2938947 RepID=UPI00208F0CEB|nr:hypothetical protein [Aliidiomarina quisquiliarum]MCO4320350.1 hypothetical protein [Aliidiomarina quisquiliarum]
MKPLKIYQSQLPSDIMLKHSCRPPFALGKNALILNRVPLTNELNSIASGQRLRLNIDMKSLGEERKFAVIGCKTTHEDSSDGTLIDLGLLIGRYSPSQQRITRLDYAFSLLEDPHVNLSSTITERTGIQNSDLKGQSICDSFVYEHLENVDFIITHHAPTQRSVCYQRFSRFPKHIPWVCAHNNIDWKAFGHTLASLESLLFDYGWFFESQRASADCMATAWLMLVSSLPFKTLLNELIIQQKPPAYEVA